MSKTSSFTYRRDNNTLTGSTAWWVYDRMGHLIARVIADGEGQTLRTWLAVLPSGNHKDHKATAAAELERVEKWDHLHGLRFRRDEAVEALISAEMAADEDEESMFPVHSSDGPERLAYEAQYGTGAPDNTNENTPRTAQISVSGFSFGEKVSGDRIPVYFGEQRIGYVAIVSDRLYPYIDGRVTYIGESPQSNFDDAYALIVDAFVNEMLLHALDEAAGRRSTVTRREA